MSKAYGVLPATAPPSTPTDLVAQDVTGGYVILAWSGDGAAYQVYRNGAPIGTPVTGTSYADSTVVPDTVYGYQVQALAAGGASALSDVLAVTTSANSPPVWSIEDQAAILGSAYSLDLRTVCTDDDSHTLTFTIASGSVPGVTVTGSTLVGTPTVAAASSLTLDAYDGYEHSQVTIAFTVSDPDVVAPSIPTGVAVSVTGSTVTVSWTASIDATGVDHYRIYRNGTFRANSDSSPYVEVGVPAGSYSYTVSAVDSSANANESAQSSAAIAIVVPANPDTPINFTAIAVSATQIDLSWAPGPNGASPDDYDLDWSLTGTGGWNAITFVGTATTYSHTGRTEGTRYYYRVRAGLGAVESGYATANAAYGGAATFIIPASSGTRTISNATNTAYGTTSWANLSPTGKTRPAGGDIIEMGAGTWGKTVWTLTGSSLANPIIVRNASGQVATVQASSFPWETRGCTYVTFDGSNGMGAWNPTESTPKHGILVQAPDTTTTPGGYVKHFNRNKGVTYKRVRVNGRKVLQANGMMNVVGSDIGFFANDSSSSTNRSTLKANNGLWGNEDVEYYECLVTNTGGECMYLGVNYNTVMAGNGLPNKNIRVRRCRMVHSGSGAAQFKTLWAGTNNVQEDNVIMWGGNDIRPADDETGHGHGLGFVGNGRVSGNLIYETRESGIKCFWDDGPNPVADGTSSTGYSQSIPCTDSPTPNKWPCYATYDVEISNNVLVRPGAVPCLIKDGTGIPYIGGTRPTNVTGLAHGITVGSNNNAKSRPKIFSNTIVDAVNNGINIGTIATGGVLANNLVLGSGDAALSGTTGKGLDIQGNITTGTPTSMFVNYVPPGSVVRNAYMNDDLDLKAPTATRALGTAGTHYTATDKDGVARGTGSTNGTTAQPDQGAYEYT